VWERVSPERVTHIEATMYRAVCAALVYYIDDHTDDYV
jgi:hypothetical protein